MTVAEANGLVSEPPAVVAKAAKNKSVPSEIGGTGLRHYGGVLYEEYLPALQGEQAIHVYREMGHDPIGRGMLMAIQNLIRKVEWTWDPAEEDEEANPHGPSQDAEEQLKFFEGALDDMSFSFGDTMATVSSKLQYGWAFVETVYKQRNGPQPDDPDAPPSSKYDDGLFGWRKWSIRGQDTKTKWLFDDNGGIQGMQQLLPNGRLKDIPIQVALLFRTSAEKESPEGESIFRAAYRPWYFKRRIEEIEAIGIERDATGMPVAYCPGSYLSASATTEEKAVVAALEELVTGIRRNEKEGLVFPRDWDEAGNAMFGLELLSSSGSRQINIDQAINRKNAEFALVALADWMLLGHEGVGSRALADPKVDLFTSALETWVQGDADVINAHAVPRLARMNGWDVKLCPTLRPSRVKQVDVKEFADTVSTLLNSGAVTPDEDLEAHIREVADLPPRSVASLAAMPDQTFGLNQQNPNDPNAAFGPQPPQNGQQGQNGRQPPPDAQVKPNPAAQYQQNGA